MKNELENLIKKYKERIKRRKKKSPNNEYSKRYVDALEDVIVNLEYILRKERRRDCGDED